MEVVVPAGQDMATKADLDAAVGAMKEYTLRTLLIALTPLSLGMLGLAIGIAGLSITG
jgi:high-affinity K+ transport system ATPase subunit B